MWTDQLTREHNGGPPYDTWRVLGRLPRDMWLCNWSSSLAPLHTYELKQAGFERVLEANSEGVNRERATVCIGNVVGLWSKIPWNAEQVGGANGYAFWMLYHGAEYSWRLHPELTHPKPTGSARFMDAIDDVLATAAWEPEPAGGDVLPLAPPGEGDPIDGWFSTPATVAVRDVAIPLWPRALQSGDRLPVNARAAALYLAVVLDADSDALAALRDGFKDKTNYAGRPVALCEVRYEDGTSQTFDLRFGWDVRARRPEGIPHALGALATRVFPAPDGSRTAVYLRQWVNPHPERVVTALTLTRMEVPGRILVVGAALRRPRG